MSDGLIPLSEVSVGRKAIVMSLQGGLSFQERVVNLGMYIGSSVEVINSSSRGRLLLAVGSSRIALGHGMATKVIVVAE